MLFHVQSAFADVSHYRGSYTSAVAKENMPKYLTIPKKECSYFLLVKYHMSVSTCKLLESGNTLGLDMISPKKGLLCT